MNKASGSDGIPAELCQILKDGHESAALNMPANLENSAVATGLENISFHSYLRERQCQRVFKLPHNCTHLTRQQSKAQNLKGRLQQHMNCELSDVQAGFRKGRGTRAQIVNIYWIIKKARAFQKNTYLCFIDYAKAFDVWTTTNCGQFQKRWEYQTT